MVCVQVLLHDHSKHDMPIIWHNHGKYQIYEYMNKVYEYQYMNKVKGFCNPRMYE